MDDIKCRPLEGEFDLLNELQYTMERIPEDDFEIFKIKTAFNEENPLIVSAKGNLSN